MRRILLLFFAAVMPLAGADVKFIRGVDLSQLLNITNHGVIYRDSAGNPGDVMEIFKAHGVNYVRLRLFAYPNGKNAVINTFDYTLASAKWAKSKGLMVLLDIHYSNTWADFHSQQTPPEWANRNHAQLVDRVFTYTRDTVGAMCDAGCPPDMVQLGNEVTNGILWPDGGSIDGPNWDAFSDLLKAAGRGVHAGAALNRVETMIHLNCGCDQAACHKFFDQLVAHGVPFDVIGLSYYPFWNGTLDQLADNMKSLAVYKKDIIVAETAHNWREGKNFHPSYMKTGFIETRDGQKGFMEVFMKTIMAVPNCVGFFYWAPEWSQAAKWEAPPWADEWAARALFDDGGNPLPAMDVYQEPGR